MGVYKQVCRPHVHRPLFWDNLAFLSVFPFFAKDVLLFVGQQIPPFFVFFLAFTKSREGNQKRKSSPKRNFSAGHPCGHPAKNFGQALQIEEEKKSSLARMCRADVHKRPLSENIGLIFRSRGKERKDGVQEGLIQ